MREKKPENAPPEPGGRVRVRVGSEGQEQGVRAGLGKQGRGRPSGY